MLAETKKTLATQSDELSSLQAAHDITRIGFASNTAALHKAEAAAATQQRKAEEAAGAAAASQAAAESLRQRLDAQHTGACAALADSLSTLSVDARALERLDEAVHMTASLA